MNKPALYGPSHAQVHMLDHHLSLLLRCLIPAYKQLDQSSFPANELTWTSSHSLGTYLGLAEFISVAWVTYSEETRRSAVLLGWINDSKLVDPIWSPDRLSCLECSNQATVSTSRSNLASHCPGAYRRMQRL